MLDNNQDLLERDVKVKSWLGVIMCYALILLSFCLFFRDLYYQDVPQSLYLICYVGLTITLILSFRKVINFSVLYGEKKGPTLYSITLIHLLAIFFIAMPALANHEFTRLVLANGTAIVCTILLVILFTFSIVYKNQNFNLLPIIRKLYIIWVVFLGVIIGYGFLIALNGFEINGVFETHTLVVKDKYVTTRHAKGGIYHVCHFVVQKWSRDKEFGNGVAIPEKWYDKYPNLQNIKTGDSVVIKVHPGTLGLAWIAPIKFIQVQ